LKAFFYNEYGDVSVLQHGEINNPKDVLGGEVLVKVNFFSLNPLDYKLRNGMLKLMTFRTFPRTTGSDFSGEVIAIGKSVNNFKVGDKVFGFLSQLSEGTSSQFIKVKESILAKIPSNLPISDAAAVPLAALTSYQALAILAKAKKGNKILINGASGGTGIFAIQIAKILGADVTSITSHRNTQWMRDEFSVNEAIDYTEENFPNNLEKNKYDIIYDCYGNFSFNKIKDFLNTHGTFITTDPFKFESIIGRLTSKFSKKSFLSVIVDSNGFDLKIIKDWIEEEKIKVFIDKKYNFSETKKAYNHLETQRVKGKIVVQMDH
jgi:NADPH:quinone reductase-like Zn-dependent oxidoreductase